MIGVGSSESLALPAPDPTLRDGARLARTPEPRVTSRTLLVGGCVLTLGAKTRNFTQADLLIDDGRVAEVGPGLRARGAETVDATDTIVMPGFVDTHRHAWTSLFRNLGEGWSGGDAPEPAAAPGEGYRPDDVYAATLISLLGAAEAGITTVVDWSDSTWTALSRTPRSRPTPTQGCAASSSMPVAAGGGATRMPSPRRDGSSLGSRRAPGPRPPSPSDHASSGRRRSAASPATGRSPGSSACASTPTSPRTRRPARSPIWPRRGLLGDDVTIAHCSGLGDADLDAIAASGASVSLAPPSERAGGSGAPPIQQLIDRNIRPGLGVGDERVAPGDLFAQMRATISLQHATVFDRKLAGKAGLPRLMSTRDVIRSATVDGARVAGLGGVTGSLEPGMQADVIVLRTDRPNVFPINDPIGAVVWGMDTSNVDWVFVGGRVLMRDGVLEADVQRARSLATAARQRLAAAAGLMVGAAPGGEG